MMTEAQRYERFMKLIENVDQKAMKSILDSKGIKLPANDLEVFEFLKGLDEEAAKIIFDAIFRNL